MNFKVGDIVVCKNADGTMGYLVIGQTYTVEALSSDYGVAIPTLILKGVPGLGFSSIRFELAEQAETPITSTQKAKIRLYLELLRDETNSTEVWQGVSTLIKEVFP